MANKPLVSVIMIFLNGEEFIIEAIASVFSQTYQNWELFLVDDGSTDNSTKIALDYATQYSNKITYLDHPNHKNRGMSASRNLGIRHSKGDYIAFLDADDVWLPDKLKEQVNILQSYPEVGMVYGRMQQWYSWNPNQLETKKDYFSNLGVTPNTVIQPPELLIMLLEGKYQNPGPSNAIMRRTTFDKVGYFEEKFPRWGEDKVFFSKVELNLPVYVAEKHWTNYRQHDNSCCAVTNQDEQLSYQETLNFFNWLGKYLSSQHTTNEQVWQELHKAKKRLLKERKNLVYRLWRKTLDFILVKGREVLPVRVRQWLWDVIGAKIYSL